MVSITLSPNGDHNLREFSVNVDALGDSDASGGSCVLEDDSKHIATGPAFGCAMRIPDFVGLTFKGVKSKEGLFGVTFLKSFELTNNQSDSHVNGICVWSHVNEDGKVILDAKLTDKHGSRLEKFSGKCIAIYPQKN